LGLQVAERRGDSFRRDRDASFARYELNGFKDISHQDLLVHEKNLKLIFKQFSFFEKALSFSGIDFLALKQKQGELSMPVKAMIQQIIEEGSILVGNESFYFDEARFYSGSNSPMALIGPGSNQNSFSVVFFDRQNNKIGNWTDVDKKYLDQVRTIYFRALRMTLSEN
jgi:hypothetical protein